MKGITLIMKEKTRCYNKTSIDFLINSLLILILFYYSYRYIFQYNSDTTSPTYSPTPIFFQTFKYILLLLLSGFLLLSVLNKKIYIRKSKSLILFTILNLINCLTLRNSMLFTLFLVLIPANIIYYFGIDINITTITNIINNFVLFSIIYEFIQIILYITIGRLPALAYSTGVITDVRFGGPWDDPNGFGIFLSFLIPFTFLHNKGLKKYLYSFILFVMLILTWSLTSWISFGIILTFSFIILIFRNILNNYFCKKKNISYKIFEIVSGFFILFILTNFFFNTNIIDVFLFNKTDSINQHLTSFDFTNLDVLTLLGFSTKFGFVESGYVFILYNSGGLFGLLLFIIMNIFVFYRNIKLIKNASIKFEKRFYISILFFQMSFVVGMTNLPLIYNFSLSGIYFFFIGFIFEKYEYLCKKSTLNFKNKNVKLYSCKGIN